MTQVRELRADDIPLIDSYWHSLTPADLERMHIDPSKLQTSEQLRARLKQVLETPLSARAADPLIWEVDGYAVGLTNLNAIERGNQAEIHLHLFDPSRRCKGVGRRCFIQAVQRYFGRHGLHQINCQPAASNPGPNGLMRALGIPVARTYVTSPSVLCFEHAVNRYEITPALAARATAKLGLPAHE